MNRVKLMGLLAVMLLALSAFGVTAQDQTIVDIAAGNEDFSTLVSLVQAAGLADVLAGEGPFTVFAPTNAAFEALPAPVVRYLQQDIDLLTRVLTYHVVAGKVMSADVAAGEVASVEGSPITVSVSDMGVMVDQASVVAVDIEASNGVIHVIDSVIIPPITLPEVDPLSVTGNIEIDGSSTVYPVTERMADLFNRDGFPDRITVDFSGTGAGFKRFCETGDTDISDASRPIKPSEEELCLAINREPLEFYIGIDALAVVVSSENTFVDNLTMEQLAQVFAGGQGITWADINAEWPAEPIRLYAPGTDSGTYDFFVEEVFDGNEEPILGAPGIQLSEDDNVLVQGVIGSPYAIGFYGYAYYQENVDVTRAIAVDGVLPTPETGASGEYPLARPLFIYSTPSIMQEKPQIAAFINYYLQNVPSQLGSGSDQIGYIATNRFIQNRDFLFWLAGVNVDSM